MTTAIAPTNNSTTRWPWLWAALVPGLFGLAGGLAVVAAVPPSLGTLFGGFAAVTVMLPALVLVQSRQRDRVVAVGCFTFALAATWTHLVYRDIFTGGEWMLAAMVLGAYGWGISGLTCLLWVAVAPLMRSPRASASATNPSDPGTLAAAGAVLAGVLWLSWPIWTAPWLSGPPGERTVARLVAVHPAFALNGRLMRAFPVPWAQYRLAYELTTIGDDIPYEMPRAIWPCVLLHALVGLGMLCPRRTS